MMKSLMSLLSELLLHLVRGIESYVTDCTTNMKRVLGKNYKSRSGLSLFSMDKGTATNEFVYSQITCPCHHHHHSFC